MNVRAECISKLRSVIFRNAIATPFTRMKRSRWSACDEPENKGDEKYRKGVGQDSSEKRVTSHFQPSGPQRAKILSFLEN
jgi:hypothetical protein